MNTIAALPCSCSRRPIYTRRRQQRGVSLIELMVGITVGLLVSVAALGTLAYNSGSARVNSDAVQLEQDAATLMRVIGRQLKQAGAVPVIISPTANKFTYLASYSGVIAGAAAPVSINGTNGASGASDTLTAAYSISPNGAASVSNCFGQAPDPLATNVQSTFQLSATGSFQCQTPAVGVIGNQTQPFLNNVEDLQFWYAVRNTLIAPPQLQYFSANNVINWNAVEAVQVCIRLAGSTTGNTTGATAGCAPNEVINSDGRIRRVYRQVFSLRNLQAIS